MSRLDASLSFRSTPRRCSRKRSPNLLVSPMYIFSHKLHFMQKITLVEVKRSVILIDHSDPVTLSVLSMKGQVLHLLRVQLKVPGDSSDFSVVRTKKLFFLLRLNEFIAQNVIVFRDVYLLRPIFSRGA